MRPIRILSIDGGGVRGIIPSQVLVGVEDLIKKHIGREEARISDYFDIIAGTSIGGILTAMYLCPDENNPKRPKFSAIEVLDILNEKAPYIFKKSMGYSLRSAFGLLRPKYAGSNIEDNFKEYLGKVKLSEVLKPCLITAYDIEKRNAVFFNMISAKKNLEKDFFLTDVVRATSAAPIYFPVANISSLADDEYVLADGGIFANNPSVCAYVEANKLVSNIDMNNVLMLSIGTGIDTFPYKFKKAKKWGAIKWSIPIFHIFMSGISETVDYEMRTMFKDKNKEENYLRIQTVLDKKRINSFSLDDCTKKNLKALNEIGKEIFEENKDELEKFVKKLFSSY
ncbi:Patatin-like phospholipase/acyl hydrolase [Clostridium cavendishii DSM 21758]|uniref:Patatin-like phospholipase/acyl hydrolase n=1 Tax=Clostridium cavendishii DSM 21758 TaxID=1121302 RepID=A0A1M6IA94_9CLOT|nr:patatin-like phospholipase family protein [Clostridium cavendishii]SHJ31370.1 Patatin-like phospholipase/acyl hydrolase [Clostridium cavendishii DSM 21758]